jgi:conjugative relaxase-like TrwC/TraI family protein
VEEVALTRLLDRQHPRTGAALPRPRRGRPPEVDGFDLMFSVPKSASVLFGLGGPRARGAVVRVQQAAVEEAMRYLDREACLVRVGPERELQRGGGLVGAAFEHRTSRAGDPQLHTHVLVANGTFRGGGAWVALDGTAIYHHARAAGHIHEAAFRRALALELGVEWGRAHNGIADVGGFSAAQLRAFSTRAGEIDVYMVEHGWGGGEARQIAALRTREAKDYDVAPEMLLPEWRERARAVGLDDPTLRAVLDRERYRPLDAAAKAEIADRLAGTGGLTAQASSFDRRDVICAFAGVARQGATLGEIEAFADAFLADRRVVALVGGGRGRRSDRDVLRLDDGRVVSAMGDATRYSTRELLGVEREVIDRAVGERAAGVAVAEPAAVERALAARPTIGPDQSQMVRRRATACASSSARPGRARRSRSTPRARRGRPRATSWWAPPSRARRRATSKRRPRSAPRACSRCGSSSTSAASTGWARAPWSSSTRRECCRPATCTTWSSTPAPPVPRSCWSATPISCPRSTPAAPFAVWSSGPTRSS